MIFLDTSFLIAFYNNNDEHNPKAIKIIKDLISGLYGELLISDYIFDEFITVALIRLKNLSKIIQVGEDIRFFTHILKINEKLFEKSWQIFKEQKATKFSFTDCTILALMKENNIKNLVTFDDEFKRIKEINLIQ